MLSKTWYSGHNNYRKHTIEFGTEKNTFTTELLDVDTVPFNTVQESLANHLAGANLPVEVLYSGGIDSECVMLSCLQYQIPVVAITMRLLFMGSPVNVHDLYYAEKFCRQHGIKQYFFDLDVVKFFGNGDHIPYMEPYKFTMFSAATILWLIKQCNSFPVIGGDYTWPQENKLYSPHRYDYSAFELFMRDQGIDGIGNMLSHSLESNMFFIEEHIKVRKVDPDNTNGDWIGIRNLKDNITQNLGFGKLETRHRSYGWELMLLFRDWFDVQKYADDLTQRYNKTDSVIVWNHKLADLIGGSPGSNSCYGFEADSYRLPTDPQA